MKKLIYLCVLMVLVVLINPLLAADPPASPEETLMGLFPLSHRPSYHAGYAHNKSESLNEDAWKNLVGIWSPDLGNTGSVVRDQVRKNHGTLTNMPLSAWERNKGGKVLRIAGTDSDDYILTDSFRNYLDPSEPWTIGINNVTLDSVGTDQLRTAIGMSDSDGAEWVSMGFFTDTDVKIASDSKTAGTGSTLALDTEYSFALTWDGTQLEGFVNGVSDYSVTPSPAITWSEIDAITIGAFVNSTGAATTTIGMLPPSLHRPSLKQGYARSQGESANPNLWDGLVGAWSPSLGNTGDDLQDQSSGNNIMEYSNTVPAWGISPRGPVRVHDGVANEHGTIGDNLDIGTGDYSLAIWVMPTATNNNDYPVAKGGTNTSNEGLCILTAAGVVFRLRFNDGTTLVQINSSTSYVANQWFLLVATLNRSGDMVFYQNGVVVGSADISSMTSDINSTHNFVLGRWSGGSNYFPGSIGDCYVWRRALKQSEIQQLYVDSQAPFRQKGQPFAVAGAATTTIGMLPPPLHRPSLKQGYARNKSESLNEGLWDGLVGAWCPSVTGMTGTTLRDMSGNHHHGTLTNMDTATDWIVTEKGHALDYDSVSDYIDTGTASWFPSTSDMTMTAWVYPHSLSGQQIAVYWGYSNGFGASDIEMHVTGGDFRVMWHTTSNVVVLPVVLNAWNHVVLRRQGTTLSGFLNGSSQGTDTGASNISFTTQKFYIGAPVTEHNKRGFDGFVGDVLVYDRGLSDAEIQQLYIDSQAPFRQKGQPFAVAGVGGSGADGELDGTLGTAYLYNRQLSDSKIMQLHLKSQSVFQRKPQVFAIPVAEPSTRKLMYISQYVNDLISQYMYN